MKITWTYDSEVLAVELGLDYMPTVTVKADFIWSPSKEAVIWQDEEIVSISPPDGVPHVLTAPSQRFTDEMHLHLSALAEDDDMRLDARREYNDNSL